MNYYIFDITKPLNFVYCGEAITNDDFIHQKRIMNDYELFIVKSGILYIEQDDIYFKIKPKNMALNLPFTVHKGYKPHSSNFSWLHFTSPNKHITLTEDELIEYYTKKDNYFSRKVVIPQIFEFSNYYKVIFLVNQLQNMILESRSKDYEDYYITLILIEISNQVLSQYKLLNENVPIRLSIMMEEIKNNVEQKIDIKQIALNHNYSEKYLYYLFKKYLNISPLKYIQKVKIDRSKMYLADSTLSIKEISSLLGFADEHHFMRLFKSNVGITASAFRKAICNI